MSRCFTPTRSETCWPLRCPVLDVALNGNSSNRAAGGPDRVRCSVLASTHCKSVRHARSSPSARLVRLAARLATTGKWRFGVQRCGVRVGTQL